VLAGIGFLRGQPVMLGAISLDLFAVLLGGATALLPMFAKDILHVGPWGLGLLRAAPAVGALLLSVWLAQHPLERRVGRTLIGAVAVFGVAMLVFALSASFWLSLIALAVSGAADMVSVVIRQTLVQLETPDAMRGRVSAVNSVFIGASNQLGEFESGATAALLGPVGSVLLGGVGVLLVAGLWTRLFPALWQRDRLHAGQG
jgi:MFS family permease